MIWLLVRRSILSVEWAEPSIFISVVHGYVLIIVVIAVVIIIIILTGRTMAESHNQLCISVEFL